jgi:hypothetical protein
MGGVADVGASRGIQLDGIGRGVTGETEDFAAVLRVAVAVYRLREAAAVTVGVERNHAADAVATELFVDLAVQVVVERIANLERPELHAPDLGGAPVRAGQGGGTVDIRRDDARVVFYRSFQSLGS